MVQQEIWVTAVLTSSYTKSSREFVEKHGDRLVGKRAGLLL